MKPAPFEYQVPAALDVLARHAAFWEGHGLQCGCCTPGFLMTLVPFLEDAVNLAAARRRQ